MKRFITTLSVLLFITGVAYGDNFAWNGSTDKFWNNWNNWDFNGGDPTTDEFPNSNGDTALIDVTTNMPVRVHNANQTIGDLVMRKGSSGTPISINITSGKTLTLDAAGAHNGDFTVGESAESSYVEKKTGTGTIAAVTMSIDASSATADTHDVTFKLSAGTLSTSGVLSMFADTGSDADAVLWLSSGTLSTNSLSLLGGTGAAGEVSLNIDAAYTNTDAEGVDAFFGADINVDVANDIVADFKDVKYDATGTFTLIVGTGSSDFKANEFRVEEEDDAAITVTLAGGGDINADSFVIKGSANNTATFTISSGSLETR